MPIFGAMLPPPFERQMLEILGPDEYRAFLSALSEPPPVSIRYKITTSEQLYLPGDPVPWHPNGRYLPERPVFTLDPLFHAGAYYVQEASSMFLYEALKQTVDFSKQLKVLDLCAAPGGKSTLIADMLGPDSLLVANEVIRSRAGILRENMEKWGAPNIAVTSAEAEEFAALEGWFDVVVTDAPCSGEGLFRKDADAIREWSPANVEICATRQRRILAAAVEALKPGGVLVFSTCTYNRRENEENTAWLAQEYDLKPLKLNIPSDWGITQADSGGYHFFPHRVRGEGLFLAVFEKKEGELPRHQVQQGFKSIRSLAKSQVPEAARWLAENTDMRFFVTPSNEIIALPAVLETEYLILDKFLKTKWFGTPIGEFKGTDFIPSHALALSSAVSPALPFIDLTREQALLFLKKETFHLPADLARGWTLARYNGLNLGWMKVLPNRMNNYLPPERRIRMDIRP
ncbi:MAG: rRNA cytosine-C5-methyltransferase [Saprospiraceae bacterium]|nr:rRNA cytosine-C5-methyltransferase [Saprospiraceae bacterium]